MGVLVVGGTSSAGSAIDSDFVAHMVVVVHSEVDIGSDIDWQRNMQDVMMLVLVQPESAPHSSSSMCQPYFP